ncbi:L-rhamnose mutarotase [bacterium]|nr:L-rhamnose mutarotase [bacterium]
MSRTSCLLLAGLLVSATAACGSFHHAARGRSLPVQRYGMVIGVKPEKIDEYRRLHAHPWPGVLTMIRECKIRNYSIYLAELEPGKHYLFGYFEYVGDDFDADMQKMAADAETQRWWKETDPCQYPIATAKPGEKWSIMEEVFHTD